MPFCKIKQNKIHFVWTWFHDCLWSTPLPLPKPLPVCCRSMNNASGTLYWTVDYIRELTLQKAAKHGHHGRRPSWALVPASVDALWSSTGANGPSISPNSLLLIPFLRSIPWGPFRSDFPRGTIKAACGKETEANLPSSACLCFSQLSPAC